MRGPDGVQNERLRSLLILDAALAFGGSLFGLTVWATSFRSGYMLLIALVPVVTGSILASAVPLVRQGRVDEAIVRFAIANWFIAIGVPAIGVFAWPLLIHVALLPAIVAVPYAGERMRYYVIVSLIVAMIVTLLGNLQDFSEMSAAAPEWAKQLVIAFFAPLLSGLVVLVAWQNSTKLGASLETEIETNNELALSRRRLVAATDRERRRIERDLHDGAQQRLVALSMRVEEANRLVETDWQAARKQMELVQAEVRATQSELRDLVRGVYPPVLTQHGLSAALRTVAQQSPLQIDLRVDGAERHPPELEAAVYFTCIEALQNSAKHGGDDVRPSVELRSDGCQLHFAVSDRGCGFDSSEVRFGGGLTNIRDRIAAVGGDVRIEAESGVGVRIEGVVTSAD